MWALEADGPVFCVSPFCDTVTGSPKVSCTMPLIAQPPRTQPFGPLALRSQGISQMCDKTNRKRWSICDRP